MSEDIKSPSIYRGTSLFASPVLACQKTPFGRASCVVPDEARLNINSEPERCTVKYMKYCLVLSNYICYLRGDNCML